MCGLTLALAMATNASTDMIKVLVGQVIGAQMQKTIKVRVRHEFINPMTLKERRKHVNYLVHDEDEACVIGDQVLIESLPKKLSKMKNFTVKEILRKARRYTCPKTGQLFSTP